MTRSQDRYISIRALKKIQQICSSLNLLGILEFTHDISFPKGEITILSTNPEVFRYWYKNSMPTIRTDENGRTLEPGIYLSNMLEENYHDCAEISPVFNSLTQASRSMSILEREESCQHLYTFSFRHREKDFIHWLVNNVTNLKNFVEYYKHSAKEIVTEAKNPSNRIVVPILKNNPDDKLIASQNIQKIMQKVIHKDSKIPIFLPRQQSICLMLLVQGKSAKEIGLAMQLSYRTVQHYTHRIKKILGCASNKELIVFYGRQVSAEEWEPIRNLYE